MGFKIFPNFGVLEYWSAGVMVEGWMSSLIPQYSSTPLLQGRDIPKLLEILALPFLGYSSVFV
jgi:hypothetical protein